MTKEQKYNVIAGIISTATPKEIIIYAGFFLNSLCNDELCHIYGYKDEKTFDAGGERTIEKIVEDKLNKRDFKNVEKYL